MVTENSISQLNAINRLISSSLEDIGFCWDRMQKQKEKNAKLKKLFQKFSS